MPKNFLNKTVYEAAIERIEFIFREFDNVLVSFSGGKDSGICLNLCYDYAKENGFLDKLAFYHLDYEAQYQMTTDYVTETFQKFDDVRRFWLCLPIQAQCVCRMDGAYWTPWAKSERDIWVREMPAFDYVVNEENAPWFIHGRTDKETQDDFSKWFTDQYGRTAVVVGIRSDESKDRLDLITGIDRNLRYKEKKWTVTKHKNSIDHGKTVLCYPIYDWAVGDVWITNANKDYAYNRLYDLFYQAGLSLNQMRVASPFNNQAGWSLKLYKVIDPNTWGKMVSRVNGVNFTGIYGGTTAMGWKSITLPKGHTWKSYLEFLLSTLDEKTREHYERCFVTSLEYWCDKGGFVAKEIIDEIKGFDYQNLGLSERYNDQYVVKFSEYPDDMNTKSFAKLPSYKRMCVCILKNDYQCKYMGFGQTAENYRRRKEVMEKYKRLL